MPVNKFFDFCEKCYCMSELIDLFYIIKKKGIDLNTIEIVNNKECTEVFVLYGRNLQKEESRKKE